MSGQQEIPKVTIITVHYNQLEVTNDFLRSACAINYENFELVVVDNGSTEEPISTELIDQYPNFRFLRSNKNLGFAGGNNYALARSDSDYYFFINNDTEILPDTISILVKTFQMKPCAGMVSPLIKYHNSNKIQYAGNSKINSFTGRSSRIGFLEEDIGQYEKIYQTDMIDGAAFMVSRDVLEKVGLMSEDFFLYYEEIDWCTRAAKAGFEIWFNGKTVVFHKESATVGKDTPFKMFYMTRNRVLFLRRNSRGFRRIIWLSFLLFFTVPKNTLILGATGQFDLLSAFFRGLKVHVR